MSSVASSRTLVHAGLPSQNSGRTIRNPLRSFVVVDEQPKPFTAEFNHDRNTYKPRVDHGVMGGTDGYSIDKLMKWPVDEAPEERGVVEGMLFWVILRMRILVSAIPLSLLVVAIRYINLTDGHEIAVDGVMLPPTITAAVFVMATVLQNVMQDYKESEKLPATLVAYFSILLSFARVEAGHYEFDVKPALRQVEDMLLCVMCTIDRKIDYDVALRGFHEAHVAYSIYLKRESHGHSELETSEHAMVEIIKAWTRIHDIGRLSIILPGYTLMDLLTMILIAVLSSVTYNKTSSYDPSGYWAVGIFATAIIYLNILVRALDDPFDGPDEYQFKCYVTGAPAKISYLDAFYFGLSIDFNCLTIDFGSYLRHLIHDETPVAGILARGGQGMIIKFENATWAEHSLSALPTGGDEGGGEKIEMAHAVVGGSGKPHVEAAAGAGSALPLPLPSSLNTNVTKPVESKRSMPANWTYSIDAEGTEWYTDEIGESHWSDSSRVKSLVKVFEEK